MVYNEDLVFECIFIERVNRFVARVMLDGEETLVHVKNTGRCKELFIEGRVAYLEKSLNENRKYLYDLIAIYKDDLLINIDSQIPNKVVADYISAGNIFSNVSLLKREVTYKNSRFDLYVEYINKDKQLAKAFIEVKGVTLFDDDLAMFPDAPTTRGAKHLGELVDAYENGYETYVFFLVQAKGIKRFMGNIERDKNFCDALKNASNKGVKVLCFNSNVTKSDIVVNEEVEVIIN